jgi:hypothetical protein
MMPPRSCFVPDVKTPLPPGAAPSVNTPLKFALCALTPPATRPPAAWGLAIETTTGSTTPAAPISPASPPVAELPPELEPPPEFELPAVLAPALPADPAPLELELPQANTQAAPMNATPKAIRITLSETYRTCAVNGRGRMTPDFGSASARPPRRRQCATPTSLSHSLASPARQSEHQTRQSDTRD